MKVYIVLDYDHIDDSETEVLGVFYKEDDAKKCVIDNSKYTHITWYVESKLSDNYEYIYITDYLESEIK